MICNKMPSDLLQNIGTFAPLEDLAEFPRVCKHFHTAFSDPNGMHWHERAKSYNIELVNDILGFVDNKEHIFRLISDYCDYTTLLTSLKIRHQEYREKRAMACIASLRDRVPDLTDLSRTMDANQIGETILVHKKQAAMFFHSFVQARLSDFVSIILTSQAISPAVCYAGLRSAIIRDFPSVAKAILQSNSISKQEEGEAFEIAILKGRFKIAQIIMDRGNCNENNMATAIRMAVKLDLIVLVRMCGHRISEVERGLSLKIALKYGYLSTFNALKDSGTIPTSDFPQLVEIAIASGFESIATQFVSAEPTLGPNAFMKGVHKKMLSLTSCIISSGKLSNADFDKALTSYPYPEKEMAELLISSGKTSELGRTAAFALIKNSSVRALLQEAGIRSIG